MKRYCRQQQKNTCVPVGVINALKWKGWNFTNEDLKQIKQDVGYSKYLEGAYMFGAFSFLKKSRYFKKGEVKYDQQESFFKRIKETIDSGGAVLISYPKTLDCSHAYLIVERHGNYYRCVNDSKTKTVTWKHSDIIKSRKHDQVIFLR